MTRYDEGNYRTESTRLSGWDYRSAAHYFITICTRDRECCLARILDGLAYVSPLGMIVAEEWWRTPYVRPYVKLDAHQVMPNHFHGILCSRNRRANCSHRTIPRNPACKLPRSVPLLVSSSPSARSGFKPLDGRTMDGNHDSTTTSSAVRLRWNRFVPTSTEIRGSGSRIGTIASRYDRRTPKEDDPPGRLYNSGQSACPLWAGTRRRPKASILFRAAVRSFRCRDVPNPLGSRWHVFRATVR